MRKTLMSNTHERPPRHATAAKPTLLAAGLALLTASPLALAQSSPYYVGVAQALAHESNVFRLADGQATPASVQKRADTVSTTSLVAGIDQPISRQRLYGSASLRANRYASNSQLNNEGYALNLGLDWDTVNRLSGTVSAGSYRNLRQFDPNEVNVGRNVQTVNQAALLARLGVVTRLTAEAGLNWNDVNYSAASYSRAEYEQTGVSLGLRYRLGGATTVGARARASRTSYNSAGDDRDRRDVDLFIDWVPNAVSSLYGRLSYGQVDAKLANVPDFKGVTGEVRGNWQATGKIRLTASLLHDTGQDSAFQSIANTQVASSDYSRTTTRAQLNADYALSAKVALTAGLGLTHRNLSNSQFNILLGSAAIDGSDDTTVLSLGARWRPNRAIQVGCDLSTEQRRASSVLSLPYSSNGFSCFGQFILQ